MKRFYFALMAILLVFPGFAQEVGSSKIKRGTLTIAGGIYGNYMQYERDDNKSSDLIISFSPTIGLFVANNFEIGLSENVSSYISKNEYTDYQGYSSTSTSSSTEYGLGIFFNQYFGSGRIKPFVGAGLDVSTVSYNYDSDYSIDDYNFVTVDGRIGGGMAIFLKKNVSLDVKMEYQFNSHKYSDETFTDFHTNIIYFGTGIRVFIPLRKGE